MVSYTSVTAGLPYSFICLLGNTITGRRYRFLAFLLKGLSGNLSAELLRFGITWETKAANFYVLIVHNSLL